MRYNLIALFIIGGCGEIGSGTAQSHLVADRSPASKTLYYFGWDSPNVEFVDVTGYLSSTQLDRMVHQLPFGGYLLHHDEETIFSNDPFPGQVGTTLAQLKDSWGSKETLLYVGATSPSDWDWTDPAAWAITEQHFRVLARAVAAGGQRGVWFDNEAYWNSPAYRQNPWQYAGNCGLGPETPTCLPAFQRGMSYHDVAAIVRQRGHALAEILHTEAPRAIMVDSWGVSAFNGYDLASLDEATREKYLSQLGFLPPGHDVASDGWLVGNNLWLPFLQGASEPLADGSSLEWVDGDEVEGYTANSGKQLAGFVRATLATGTSLLPPSAKYTVAEPVYDDYLRALPDDTAMAFQYTSPLCAQPLDVQLKYITDRAYYSLRLAGKIAWYYSEGEHLIDRDHDHYGHVDEVVAAIAEGQRLFVEGGSPTPTDDLPTFTGHDFCPRPPPTQ